MIDNETPEIIYVDHTLKPYPKGAKIPTTARKAKYNHEYELYVVETPRSDNYKKEIQWDK